MSIVAEAPFDQPFDDDDNDETLNTLYMYLRRGLYLIIFTYRTLGFGNGVVCLQGVGQRLFKRIC